MPYLEFDFSQKNYQFFCNVGNNCDFNYIGEVTAES